MPTASDRKSKSEKELGGAARSSNETGVSSAENPNPKLDGTGNTATTRPHPDGAKLTPEEIARTAWRATGKDRSEKT
jgi:hypothetical protein